MDLLSRPLLSVSLLVLTVLVCEREAVASGAPGDSRQALMHAAFPKWNGRGPWIMKLPPDGPDRVEYTVATTPQRVLAIDESHRVLVFAGSPSDDQGNNLGGHPAGGILGAVWFVRSDGRWVRTSERDEILETGFFGDLGRMKPLDLGGGHQGVSIENGSCWQGLCADFLSVVEFGPERALVLLKGEVLMSSAVDGKEGCPEALGGGTPVLKADPSPPSAKDCFDVHGKWRIRPSADLERRGDLVIRFTGTDLVDHPKTQKSSPRRIAQTLVLRYAGGVYKRVSGRNPTHPI